MRSSSPTISPVAAGLSQARPCPNSRQKQSLNRFSTRPRVGICSLPFGFASSIPCDSFSISVFHQEHAVSPFFSPAADLLQYDFEGRKDLVKFVKTVGDAGLYVYLAVGPFICGEWNYGGFPLWLHFIPRIQFRTDNEPFKREMQCFTAKIVDMIKQEKLFASQGGPIILAQHYRLKMSMGSLPHPMDQLQSHTSIGQLPWLHLWIRVCHGLCPSKEMLLIQLYLYFGGRVPYRPVEDITFAVARFFQRGGTYQNYYMYHGGTNFGRSTGGPLASWCSSLRQLACCM